MTNFLESNSNSPDTYQHIQQEIEGNNNQTIGQVFGGIILYEQVTYNIIPTKKDEIKKYPGIGNNPYKGLQVFQKEDWNNFFGRSQEIEILFSKFRGLYTDRSAIRFLPIFGSSGSGKSSLVQAGLLKRLSKTPLPGCEGASVTILVPGESPIESLARTLASISKNKLDPNNDEIEELTQELNKSNNDGEYDGLYRIVDKLSNINNNFPLIILVDQLEEIYSRCKKVSERNVFINNLLYAARATSRYVSVIVTFRSDFLREISKNPELDCLFSKQGYKTYAMNKENLREVIIKPAENAGYSFDEATVQLLVQQTFGRKGALPLLQFTLKLIWENLSKEISPVETLKNIGGVGGALTKEARRVYEQLNETEKAIARRLFLGLVQLGEDGQDTRRRIAIENIIARTDCPKRFRQVVECFANQTIRLITLSYDGKTEKLEITHEALLEHWEQLKDWLKESRDKIKQQRKLEDEAKQWEDSGQKTDYLLLKKRLREDKDFQKEQKEKYPLSELAENFIAESIKHQRRERIKSWGLLLIISLIGTAIGVYFVFRDIRLNADQKLIQNCSGKKDCEGRIEALERLVRAGRSFYLYNFSGANLDRADLENADLKGAQLYQTKLSDANLKSVNLSSDNDNITNLHRADLEGADLEGANLDRANLDRANLDHANLDRANLKNAILVDEIDNNPTSSQIKSACNWEKAYYKGKYDYETGKWNFEEQDIRRENQQYIDQLKKDKASDPKEKVDCSRWE